MSASKIANDFAENCSTRRQGLVCIQRQVRERVERFGTAGEVEGELIATAVVCCDDSLSLLCAVMWWT